MGALQKEREVHAGLDGPRDGGPCGCTRARRVQISPLFETVQGPLQAHPGILRSILFLKMHPSGRKVKLFMKLSVTQEKPRREYKVHRAGL